MDSVYFDVNDILAEDQVLENILVCANNCAFFIILEGQGKVSLFGPVEESFHIGE